MDDLYLSKKKKKKLIDVLNSNMLGEFSPNISLYFLLIVFEDLKTEAKTLDRILKSLDLDSIQQHLLTNLYIIIQCCSFIREQPNYLPFYNKCKIIFDKYQLDIEKM